MYDNHVEQIHRVGRVIKRVIAAITTLMGVLLLAAAVWFHFNMEPIMGLMFVGGAGYAGLMLLFFGLQLWFTGKFSGISTWF